MARNTDEPRKDESQGSNLADKKEIIASAAAARRQMEARIKSIRETWREDHGSALKAIGMKMADFNAAYRLQTLEDEERDESMENMRVCFLALGIGSQGALFPDLFPESDDRPVNTDHPAYKAGWSAAFDRKPESLNTHPDDSFEHRCWAEGYREGAEQIERADKMADSQQGAAA